MFSFTDIIHLYLYYHYMCFSFYANIDPAGTNCWLDDISYLHNYYPMRPEKLDSHIDRSYTGSRHIDRFLSKTHCFFIYVCCQFSWTFNFFITLNIYNIDLYLQDLWNCGISGEIHDGCVGSSTFLHTYRH